MREPRAAEVAAWLATVVPRPARLSADSRQIRPGDIFFAWPGEQHDGRDHVAAALAAGAVAVVHEQAGGDECAALLAQRRVPARAVSGLRDLAGPIASAWLDEPTARLQVVAVTGTNGKTSCTHWIADGWNAGCTTPEAVVIGTLGAGVPGALDETGLTTPDALSLQQAFAGFVAAGIRTAAIEASSIGLAQGRLNGSDVDVAVLTNLSRDHLDYHGSMAAYADAKASLFNWPGLRAAVVNLEDPLSTRLLEGLRPGLPCIGYLIDDSVLGPVAAARTEAALARADRCSELLIATPGQRDEPALLGHVLRPARDDQPPASASIELQLDLLGRYNLCNALAVAGAWRAFGWPLATIAERLAGLRPVPGRLEVVGDGAGTGQPLVVVDYAHTPDALSNALGALRPVVASRGGQLWCVFGAGGDRDPGKRPLMAAAVEAAADRLVVTSDNPRSESPDAIIAGLLAGLRTSPVARLGEATARVEPDRAQAIRLAIADARPADVVLIAGKGHERYQEIAGVRHPFSDVVQAGQALALRNATPGHSRV